jgi:hypothetical protein
MPSFTRGTYPTLTGHDATVTSVGTDGRLFGHVPGAFTSTWWHPDGRHNLFPPFSLDPDLLQPFDHASAQAEGWDVVEKNVENTSQKSTQIKAVAGSDDVARFSDDREAWAHVVARAREGSHFHRAALKRVDNVERAVIEIAHGRW